MNFDSWMGDRAVYCARLESVCAERHPGFESPPIRRVLRSGLTSRLGKRVLLGLCAAFLSALLASGVVGATDSDISNLLEKAKGEFHEGNFGESLTLLDQIDKAKSGNAESLDLRGSVYFELGKSAEAKKAFHAASEADANAFAPRLHLADVLLREKKFSDARDAYTDLIEKTNIQTQGEKLRYGVLLTYLFENNEVRAQTALDRITFPTESAAYYYAQAAWEFAHKRKGDAIKWLKAASRMFGSKGVGWFARPLYDYGWTKEKPPPSTL